VQILLKLQKSELSLLKPAIISLKKNWHTFGTQNEKEHRKDVLFLNKNGGLGRN
jgi:hypothetical protein